MYYHPRNEESKLPNVKITNFKVVRILPKQQSLDSLYIDQFDFRIFDIESMNRFIADTIPPMPEPMMEVDSLATREIQDSLAIDESQDSLALRTR